MEVDSSVWGQRRGCASRRSVAAAAEHDGGGRRRRPARRCRGLPPPPKPNPFAEVYLRLRPPLLAPLLFNLSTISSTIPLLDFALPFFFLGSFSP
ncbi:Os12g0509850 [Oryza sativa Japonica Group]|uniref:Os12g0509850 protein n=1 Tax=Oryza sativa subsp. japonica TaxID=39947 RepID=C7J9V0_ORYSJ|nr:Os12g0509850 [Oryza sativa Japonica Group]|eukprot:NP_001176974.1 Os12g0509850 [Oryza sativa Japonica Group]